MKTTLVLLGIVASALAPFSAQADPESFRSGDTTGTVNGKKHQTRSERQVFYITSQKVTGSNLPLVVGRYKGTYYSMSPNAVYGRPDLDRTGQLNVASELTQRDPAFSSAVTTARR